jgi:hypothetical protein
MIMNVHEKEGQEKACNFNSIIKIKMSLRRI